MTYAWEVSSKPAEQNRVAVERTVAAERAAFAREVAIGGSSTATSMYEAARMRIVVERAYRDNKK